MDQTPITDVHNETVLNMIPKQSKKLIEIGCGSGALAREFKKINPTCHYTGLDIVQSYTQVAKKNCDEVIFADIEKINDFFYIANKDCDCWIFADSLEHLIDPWEILKKIRQVIPANGSIVACIPNAQNWRVVANLLLGNFRYQEMGLLDKTHLRWFTRQTIIELFESANFKIESISIRTIEDRNNIALLPLIGNIAKFLGADSEMVINDSVPFQYVVHAIPK